MCVPTCERKKGERKGERGGVSPARPFLFFWSKLRFFFYMWHEATALRQLHKSPTTMQCTRLTKSGCLNCNTHTQTFHSSLPISLFLILISFSFNCILVLCLLIIIDVWYVFLYFIRKLFQSTKLNI